MLNRYSYSSLTHLVSILNWPCERTGMRVTLQFWVLLARSAKIGIKPIIFKRKRHSGNAISLDK